MVTAEEALTSNDPTVVKRLRGSISAQVTSDLNILEKELSKKQGEIFNYEGISPQLIKIQKKKLLSHFDILQKLHERYAQIREEGVDEEVELTLVEADSNYIETITTKVCPILDLIDKYEEGLSHLSKSKVLLKTEGVTQEAVAKAKRDFVFVHDKIKQELERIEAHTDKEEKNNLIQLLPTESFIKDLHTSFNEVKKHGNKLKEINRVAEQDGEESKPEANYDIEHSNYFTLDMRLKMYEQARVLFKAKSPVMEGSSAVEKSMALKINKPDALKFSGNARDFASFKRDFMAIVVPFRDDSQIGMFFKQAIPDKHKHLLSNKDLNDWKSMMSIIEEELATPKMIVDITVNEIEKMKMATTDKGFIEFVESLEKIVRDLSTLSQISEIANTSVLSKLEAKLPARINHDWAQKVINDKLSKKTSQEKFEIFMEFLKAAKEMTKYCESLPSGTSKQHCFVTGTVMTQNNKDNRGSLNKNKASNILPCLACSIDGATDLNASLHSMSSCMVWNSLSHAERVALVKCVKHPFSTDGHLTKDCRRNVKACVHCKRENEHNSLLCSKFQIAKKGSTNISRKSLTSTSSDPPGRADLPPTLLYTTFVKTKGNRKLGALIDNGSTDDYILNKTAKRMKLKGHPVELVTEGFGGQETKVCTKLYYVPIIDVKGRTHYLPCYGTEIITSDSTLPDASSYNKMCKRFGVDPNEVQRPSEIELLVSLRSGHLHPNDPNPMEIDGMRLVSGPLGKVFGGFDPELNFKPISFACPLVAAQVDTSCPIRSTTMKAIVHQSTYTTPLRTDKEILNFFDEEQIGVHCEPRCGDCRCGSCTLGSKQMSIKDEKEYEKFKSLMQLDVLGTEEDPGPYWRTGFPWTVEPSDLVDNRAAVTAVMHSTERKLNKNLQWREVYELQLRTLVEKGFAKEVTAEEITAWEKSGGKTYFIAHQMAINPQSKTTPVRCCFNSSQRYKGYSLNTSWELGPDLVNSLHSVLLRFRKDLVGAQGDITKMYYMVRILEAESWMQLFMWKFHGEGQVRYFKMQRLVMGNKPSASLSGVALSETAKLMDFPIKYPAAYKALTSDAYVDNVFLTAPDHTCIRSMIEEIETVAAEGGFFFKPFIVSGDNQPDVVIGAVTPDAIGINEEKALGVFWDVYHDMLYIKGDLFKAGKKPQRGNKVAEIMIDPSYGVSIAPHLTLRLCLSLHSRPFDPLGFILPTRVIGNLLFRLTLQIMKKGTKGRIPWDEIIDGHLKSKWCEYFGMLVELEKIKFPRSFKPEGVDSSVRPDFCTFNDGNPDAYGTVGYARWTLVDGTKCCRLMLSKSRLGPLTYKGETVRNELSGATLSARLKHWVTKNSEVEFGQFYHFLDSQIVKDMIAKDSYGYSTFFGLRVAEVQQKTSISDWKHVPSAFNISDILTKGVQPNSLGPGSEWQAGPSWLCQEESQWPISIQPVRETAADKSELEQYFKKSKVLVKTIFTNPPDGIDELINRCSSLRKLLHSVAYVLRWRLPSRTVDEDPKTELNITLSTQFDRIRPISASEKDDAMNILVALDQRRRLSAHKLDKFVPKTITFKLNNYPSEVSHIVVGGRIKNFPIAFSGHCQEIPVLPPSKLSELIVKHYHDKFHNEVDTTVAHVRNDYWVIRCRKLASRVDNTCIYCKLQRKSMAKQVMGELPDFRTSMQPAFKIVGCDLWGPLSIRDDVIKRGPRVTKKVWGVLITCMATRAIYLDVACGNSTEELIHVLRRAMTRCGDIQTIISDPGTNLVGASREMADWRRSWDQAMLDRFGAKHGIQWITVMADSQHQNGVTEIMIKLAKSVMKSLLKSIGSQVLSLNELNTLLAEASQLVNERPIGLKPNENVDSVYLSPNSLLLGRNSDRICSGPFSSVDLSLFDPSTFKNRFLMVQAVTEQFWKNWMKLYFPSLVVRQRWHVEKRNLCVGDVCAVRDRNMLRGEWRIATVTTCYPDRHNRVRNVELTVKPKQGGGGGYVPATPIIIRRHVSNVVVLVPVEESIGNTQEIPNP